MRMRYMFAVVALCGIAVLCSEPRSSVADQAADRAAIEAAIESYEAAFNARDAAKFAAHWAPGAVYVNPLTGTQVDGREAIAKEFEAMLAALGDVKLSTEVEAIRFISPGVAVENGTARIISGDGGPPDESTYTAIHVKRDGKWLLDRVTEEDPPVVLYHYEHLKELEWLIGTWVDEDEDGRIETTCHWTRNRNFITRWFTISIRDRVDLAGMQLIGWDPASKQIRSWVFDSDGGFGEGRWSRKDDRWSVTTKSTLPDGSKATSVNVFTYVDEDHFKWKSVNRMVDGELLPNVDEVLVGRVQEVE